MQFIVNIVCCSYGIQVQLGILHFHLLNLAAVVPGEEVLDRVSRSLVCWQKKELHLKLSEDGGGKRGCKGRVARKNTEHTHTNLLCWHIICC